MKLILYCCMLASLGFLARAYLQTVEYDDTKALAGKALETAKELIADCEAGGAKYNRFLYPSFEEAEADVYANGGSGAAAYINKIRARAGATALSGAVTVQTVLDERAASCAENMFASMT